MKNPNRRGSIFVPPVMVIVALGTSAGACRMPDPHAQHEQATVATLHPKMTLRACPTEGEAGKKQPKKYQIAPVRLAPAGTVGEGDSAKFFYHATDGDTQAPNLLVEAENDTWSSHEFAGRYARLVGVTAVRTNQTGQSACVFFISGTIAEVNAPSPTPTAR